MQHNFAAFILTHGRPDLVYTYDTLVRQGYTGPIYIILDDEDTKISEYQEKFGIDRIIVFNKIEVAKQIDVVDNFDGRLAIVYARNACFDIAKQLGLEYFIVLDDDYTQFRYTHDDELNYVTRRIEIKNLDLLFTYLLDFYTSTNITSLGIAQGGDFIGGISSNMFKKKISRKCMNSWICSTARPFKFSGRMNEDVSAYVLLGSRGHIFFTLAYGRLEQIQTQQADGGMTEVYRNNGTYVKSFYTVIQHPSSVKIRSMGKLRRLHHSISWNHTVPKIIEQKYKKE